jgi:hypothetical protein
MRILNNEKLIKRNKIISRIVLISSLGLLAAGFFWSLGNPDSVSGSFTNFILIPAYLLVQISIYLSNRWGREPRPDQIIAAQLKGLNNEYSLINYYAGVPHLLIGPAGMKIINPYHQSGKITFDEKKNRFKQKGGANFLAKIFGQENIPNIIRDSSRLKKDLSVYLEEGKIQTKISMDVINFFHSEKAEIVVQNSPVSVIHARKLKDTIRKEAKLHKIDQSDLVKLLADISEKTGLN